MVVIREDYDGLFHPDSTSSLQTLANEHCAGNFQQLSKDLNSFFQGISSDVPRLEYKPIQTDPVPKAYIITVSDVEKCLMRIEIIKAIGPDYIPNWVLRDCAPLLVPHLHAYSTRALEKATYQLCESLP